MIRDYEIGAVFAVVDDATAPLRKILESVRELNKAIKIARDGMAGFGAAVAPGIGGAILETNKLAGAWTRAAESSVAAARVMNESAAKAAAAARTAAAASVPRSGIGAAAAGGAMGHMTGPSISLPGKSHLNLGGTPAMVAAGAGAYSLFEASGMEKGVLGLKYHLGIDAKDTSHDAEIRKVIEEGMVSTGKDMNEVVEAATDAARLMRDTPGFDVVKELPRLLRAAQTEALSKGTSLKESMKSIVGLAHMVRAYKPGEMEKLFQVFAYYSTANPAGLPSMEKTLGYAIPILQSGADIDPKDVMALSTVLATSGVTSSKAGTWLREFGVRAMPGNAKHNELLTRLGLLDAEGKPTWYTNGKPDLPKALSIAGPRAAAMPPEERLPLEMELFGRRGGGAFAVLGGDVAQQRYRDLRAGQENPANIARYNAFNDAMMGTTRGVAKSTLQEFNVAMIELGTSALPIATAGLRVISGVLHGLNFIQGATPKGDKQIGLPLQRGGIPRLWNYLTGPKETGDALKPEKQSLTGEPMRAQPMNFLQGPPPTTPKVTQTAFSFNVDGRVLAQTIIEQMENLTEHATGSPNANELSHFARADSGMAST
jgi:hypothetical protein